LPDNRNNAELLQVTAWVNRRSGNWDKTLELLHQAEALAPRDLRLFYSIGETYAVLLRWDRAQEYLDKTSALGPTHARTMQLKADIAAGRDGDFVAGARFAGLAKQDQRFMAAQHWEMLLRVGDYDGALEAAVFLDAQAEDFLDEIYGGLSEGLTHAYFGNDEAARPLLETVQANLLQAEADDDPRPRAITSLAYALCEVHAALGLKDEAIRLCLAARENIPDDAMVIPPRTFDIGVLLAWAGAADEAMTLLIPVAESGIGYSKHWYLADKRLDGLHDHPEWPALMAALEQEP
jgi:tetratricopeptide (TPR) repeat protein